MTVAKIIQNLFLPFYKIPMPQYSSYRKIEGGESILLGNQFDWEYKKCLDKIERKLKPARIYHGAMHAARVVLWTQILIPVYERLGREKIKDPLLLAVTGGLHDAARENEGPDFWDGESSEILKNILKKAKIPDEKIAPHVQAIEEKDPNKGNFSTDIQRIAHDADCLEGV